MKNGKQKIARLVTAEFSYRDCDDEMGRRKACKISAADRLGWHLCAKVSSPSDELARRRGRRDGTAADAVTVVSH